VTRQVGKKTVLVKEYLERVGGDVLEGEHFRSILAAMIRGHAGVYALYKDEKLYYVGLASNLMGRVKHHLRDRHARKWNRFSVYLTSKGEHVKPIESLLLRIVDPVGNRVKGRLPGAQDLKRELNRKVSAHQAQERARLLGDEVARKRLRRKAAAAKGSDALAGLVERRLALRVDYKGQRYLATLRKNGQVSYAGEQYESPSAAARAIVGRAANGWHFWWFKQGREWVRLRELRR
jgi:Restriction Enzyme Adenine Methylase Associated/Protein of unknown function (DUF2924)